MRARAWLSAALSAALCAAPLPSAATLYRFVDESGVLHYTLIGGLGGLAWIALFVSHVIQGIDAYGRAGGGRIVEWTREHAVEWASSDERAVPVTTRAFALHF